MTRPSGRICGATLALLALLAASAPVRGQRPTLEDDPFATHLVGEWMGDGVYQGNRLELTRTWSMELGAAFLRADMRVTMPNGASFGGLMYWKAERDGRYRVIWLDGSGRMQELEAERVPGSSVVRTDFVDEQAEGGSERRRWEYQRLGPDSYSERLLRQVAGEWELLTEWTFLRTGTPPPHAPL